MKQTICNDIYWVGALEWSKDHFHGHELSIRHGTSYNSYFINDEKKVLIDVVRDSHLSDLADHISQFCKIEELDILIINHAEPDHASGLPRLLQMNPNIEIYVSRGGKISVTRHFPGAEKNLKVSITPPPSVSPTRSTRRACGSRPKNTSPISSPFIHSRFSKKSMNF
ncbi:MAG TPA: hypothetical protein PKC25_14950 [Candidatus Rifleibacterium sp.]|nr:hypothetical protein [Candidatus Rifleibacterium sp.]